MNNHKFNIRPDWASGDLEFSFGKYTDGKLAIATEITFVDYVQGTITKPLLRLSNEDAQLLMDSLFAAGVRPSKEFGASSQFESIKYHLEDMRKLVFQGVIS